MWFLLAPWMVAWAVLAQPQAAPRVLRRDGNVIHVNFKLTR